MTSYEPPANGFRTFLIVWASQAVSVFGTALTFFATTIWLTQVLYPRPEQKPALAAALSAISIVFAVPAVFGAPIAGAWADRHDRKRIMMTMDSASAVFSLVLTVLLATGALQLWMLLGIVFLFATASAFHGAAFDASYAMLVPEAQLPRANGMMQTIWSLSGILSPAIAAGLISLPGLARQGTLPAGIGDFLGQFSTGTPLATGLDALTFLFAATTLLFLRIPSPVRTDLHGEDGKTKKSLWSDIGEGAKFIWRRRPILWLLGTFTVANFVSSPVGVFTPLIVKFTLAPDWQSHGATFEATLALLSSVAAVGGVAGGLLISAWGGLKKRRIYGVLVPMIISGVAQIVFGLSSAVLITAVAVMFVDGMTPILNAHSQAIWQSQTPRELQGRVFSVRRLIAQFTWPLSTALAGLAGGLFDPGVVMAVLGAVLVVFCVAQFFNPYLRRIEDKSYLDDLAARPPAPGPAAPARSS